MVLESNGYDVGVLRLSGQLGRPLGGAPIVFSCIYPDDCSG
jgi:hypothetical protein